MIFSKEFFSQAVVSKNNRVLRTWLCLLGGLLVLALPLAATANNRNEVVVHLFSARKPPSKIELLSSAKAQLEKRDVPLSPGDFFAVRQSAVAIYPKGRPDLAMATSRIVVLNANQSGVIKVRVDGTLTRSYRGTLRLRAAGNSTLYLENSVLLKDYIVSVVGSEAPPVAPAEMLKAQAILTQTHLARLPERKPVEDSTEYEVYQGVLSERPAVRSAVASVSAKMLLFEGSPVQVFFHSTCAGGTSSATDYFSLKSNSLPYLKAVPCSYCKQSPFWRESVKEIPWVNMQSAFGPRLPTVAKRDASGRPLEMTLADARSVSAYKFWLAVGEKFGWDKLPGTRFSLNKRADGMVELRSRGAGHGVGMCQWGAIGLAEQGKNYEQILSYYFPRCRVK